MRAAATANGLAFTGTFGILATAKARGKLKELAPILHALKTQARFWISPRLERLLLDEAAETGWCLDGFDDFAVMTGIFSKNGVSLERL